MTTGDEVTADPTTAAESDTVTLEVAPEAGCALDANAFTLRGHTFTGWNTVAGGTGTAYADGATVNLAENTTLYAQWTQNPFIVADIPDQTYSGSAIRPVVVKDADGYGIYFGRCATGDYPLIASVRRSAPRSYRVTGLKKARAYRAHVKARKKVKGVKTYIGETSPPGPRHHRRV